MRKYIILIVASILLLELAAVIIFREQLLTYISRTASELLSGVVIIGIIVAGILWLLRSVFR